MQKKKPPNSFALISAVPVLLTMFLYVAFTGCDKTEETNIHVAKFLDESIEQTHSLGWLGANSHPLTQNLSMPDPEDADANISPGGIVLAKVLDGYPLAESGLKQGDVIVRIAGDWVPIKEDPTLDFIAAVEDQISAKKNEISIGFYRSGLFQTVTLTTDLTSLDEGLPLATKRIVDASTACLRHLASLQEEDGSFAAEHPHAELLATSLAGLAFLSADHSVAAEFDGNVAQCTEFLSANLDAPDSGSRTKLDPLTASYIVMFIAESNIQLMDEDWLEKIGAISNVFPETQNDSGAWGEKQPDETVEDDESGEQSAAVDVLATYTTHQVLLAIGALERKGMSGDNEIIEKGCGYLKKQASLRVPCPIDRRIKAALSAGSAAALVTLNCDRNDLDLKQYLKDALERVDDLYTSPSLALPGLLNSSIIARQMGNESWIRFHNAIKYLAVSLQNVDGGILEYPNIEREPLGFEASVDAEVWRTAHIGLMLSMQSLSLENLLALNDAPVMLARDSSGKQSADAGGGPSTMSGSKIIQLDGGGDMEDIKNMIMEQLKEQGMDVDESKLKIKSSSKLPEDD